MVPIKNMGSEGTKSPQSPPESSYKDTVFPTFKPTQTETSSYLLHEPRFPNVVLLGRRSLLLLPRFIGLHIVGSGAKENFHKIVVDSLSSSKEVWSRATDMGTLHHKQTVKGKPSRRSLSRSIISPNALATAKVKSAERYDPNSFTDWSSAIGLAQVFLYLASGLADRGVN